MRVLRHALSPASRRGTILVAAIVTVLLVVVMSVAYLQLSTNRHHEIRGTVDAKRAFYIAEAGLSEAYLGIVTGRSGNVGSDLQPARFANGVFWVTVQDEGNRRVSLKSTGLCGSGRAALSMVIENVVESVASLGFFAGSDLVVMPGCVIDSYDSRHGSYEMQRDGPAEARVGSNADIDVQATPGAPTIIHGDATPGRDGAVTRGRSATVVGSTTPREAAVDLPEIEPPDLPSAGEKTLSKRGTVTVGPSESSYTNLWVKTMATLVIVGPSTIVTNVLRVDSGGTLTIDATNGPVKVFVLDALALRSGSTLSSTSHTPATAALLVSAFRGHDLDGDGVENLPVELASGGQFYGTIYAPDADVTLPNSLEIFGSVAARTLAVGTGARIHFDAALGSLTGGEVGLPRISCWRIVDLPQVDLVKNRVDPLFALGRAGITPTPAKDAHFEVGVAPPSGDPNVTPFTGGLPDCAPPNVTQKTPPPPEALPLLARLDEFPAVSSSDLKDELISAGTLDESVLTKMILRQPAMTSSDVKAVLTTKGPLSATVLGQLLLRDTPLASSDLRDVLIGSSPLPARILTILTTAIPPRLSPSDLVSVLGFQ